MQRQQKEREIRRVRERERKREKERERERQRERERVRERERKAESDQTHRKKSSPGRQMGNVIIGADPGSKSTSKLMSPGVSLAYRGDKGR